MIPVLAEVALDLPKFTMSDLATILTIGGVLGASAVYLFGTKFVSRISYEEDRKEYQKQLQACHDALIVTAQTHKELKGVMETLSQNIKENTSVTHALDKRLSILEALRNEQQS